MERDAQLQALAAVSARLATAASLNLEARVEHCPAWSVRDLVDHIAGVQWFWSDILDRRVTSFDDRRKPPSLPTDVDPVGWFREQTAHLLRALRSASDLDHIWTWWEPDQSAKFVLRRQVNEAVIHGFDACHAVGIDESISIELAELGLQEFAEVMSKDLREGSPTPQPISLVPSDSQWRGLLFADANDHEPLEFRATARELLLSLWGRYPLADARVAEALSAIDLS